MKLFPSPSSLAEGKFRKSLKLLTLGMLFIYKLFGSLHLFIHAQTVEATNRDSGPLTIKG